MKRWGTSFVLGLCLWGQNSEAAIVFTPVDITLFSGGADTSVLEIADLNGDGNGNILDPNNDFIFGAVANVSTGFRIDSAFQSGNQILTRNVADAARLQAGEVIGPDISGIMGGGSIGWQSGSFTIELCGINGGEFVCVGDFTAEPPDTGTGLRGYIGLEFFIGGETHYGWAEVEANGFGSGGTIFGWAYESEAGVPIEAGAVPEPSTVLFLYLGGLTFWWRRRR